MEFDEIDLTDIAPINFVGVSEEEKEKILDALGKVVDPEVGVDIINLGLVYDVVRREDGVLHVKMTMTSMGCPFTPSSSRRRARFSRHSASFPASTWSSSGRPRGT